MPPKEKKQKQKSSIGRALINQKKREQREFYAKLKETRHVHPTSGAPVHKEASLKSITQQTDLAAFMSKVEMNQLNYESRLCNIRMQSASRSAGVLTDAERQQISKAQQQNAHRLRIPRRPLWTTGTSKEKLDQMEEAAFHEWRLHLEQLSHLDNITVTPYEKNLRVWQQLWRVVERSDVVVQIVDARNPLMFRCCDLERYVKEVDPAKVNVLLVNKSDLLSEEQRQAWTSYFNSNGIFAVFFSALAASADLGAGLSDLSEEEEEEEAEKDQEEERAEEEEGDVDQSKCENLARSLERLNLMNQSNCLNNASVHIQSDADESDLEYESANSSLGDSEHLNGQIDDVNSNCDSHDISSSRLNSSCCEDSPSEPSELCARQQSPVPLPQQLETTSKLHNREELITLLQRVSPPPRMLHRPTTIGLVGYPNVGKSSTINCLMQRKCVKVSATPGKTKHFQTHYLTPELVLCDCPGLVFPGFVSTLQEMIIWGILPIDEIRGDYLSPVTLVCNTLAPAALEAAYSIPLPAGHSRPPTAEELLSTYAVTRSFMSARGRPDTSHAGRVILKHFMNGRLLYCVAPPGADQQNYHTYTVQPKCKNRVRLTPMQKMMMPETADDRDAALNSAFGLQQEAPQPGGKRPRKPRVKKPKGYVEYTEDENGPVMIITKPWRNRESKQRAGKKNPNLNNPYAEHLW